jgi:hypothetical protein
MGEMGGKAAMSFTFFLYRAHEGLPPITQWPDMLCQAIGSPEEVRDSLSALLEQVEWIKIKDDHSFCQAVEPRYHPSGRFSIHLQQDGSGAVVLLGLSNHASPSTLAAVMDRFGLNYCCTSLGDLRQPHACDDHWNRTPP